MTVFFDGYNINNLKRLGFRSTCFSSEKYNLYFHPKIIKFIIVVRGKFRILLQMTDIVSHRQKLRNNTLLYKICHQNTKSSNFTNLIHSFCVIWRFGDLVARKFSIFTGQ